MLTGISGEPGRAGAVLPARGLDEEVQQRRRLAGGDDEHIATGPQPGQQRLTGEGREHRPERSVDRVAAVTQHIGPGAGADRMAGGDDAELVSHSGNV